MNSNGNGNGNGSHKSYQTDGTASDIDTNQDQFQNQNWKQGTQTNQTGTNGQSGQNGQTGNNKRPIIPSKQMDQLKQETAASLGIDLANGNLTAKDAGKVGGNMVKKMIQSYENGAANQSQNR